MCLYMVRKYKPTLSTHFVNFQQYFLDSSFAKIKATQYIEKLFLNYKMCMLVIVRSQKTLDVGVRIMIFDISQGCRKVYIGQRARGNKK